MASMMSDSNEEAGAWVVLARGTTHTTKHHTRRHIKHGFMSISFLIMPRSRSLFTQHSHKEQPQKCPPVFARPPISSRLSHVDDASSYASVSPSAATQ